MFENVKKRIIKDLIDDIAGLDPSGLELVGHCVISLIEGKSLLHHGINKNYRPSGYTVDSFSHGSTIVAEYSAENKYFDDTSPTEAPKYVKIENDIKHAIAHKPPSGPEKIYLVTSQEEPPSFRAHFNKTDESKSLGDRLIIIDARELAKYIYAQSISNPSIAVYYKSFFPGFSLDLDNYEYYGKIPAQCERHLSDPAILDAINGFFVRGQQRICVVHGLSGSGKTQAAIDYIHNYTKVFENYIWISGDDWRADTSLSAIQRTRGGAPINVAGLFNSSKTILVIDGVERILVAEMFAELASGFDRGSVILATSQITAPANPLYLAMPLISYDVATKILGENPTSISSICNRFVRECRFSPLILSTARNVIESGDFHRDDFYTEILNAPCIISGPDGTSIMRRILSKLGDAERLALEKISNSCLSVHDLGFLRYFTSINSCASLQRLSILLPTSTPGVVKIHDLISLASQTNPSNTLLAESIEGYINKHSGDMTPSVLREIHLGKIQLSSEYIRRGSRSPDWIVYALLQIEGDEKAKICRQIYNIKIQPETTLASAMSIIDAREVHSYNINDDDERIAYYNECAETYGSAFAEATSDDIKAELVHHRGKALRRCGRFVESLDCFIKLLKLRPNWHAAHGQIAHLGMQRQVDAEIRIKGEESMNILMGDMFRDSSSVPLRVSLAALARLRSYPSVVKRISSEPYQVQLLSDIISNSSLDGFGQFYEAFVSFTSIFGYHHGSCCMNLAEAIPELLAMPPHSVESKQWVSACEGLINTAQAAIRVGKDRLSSQIVDTAIKFADAVLELDGLRPYDARAIAKAYIQAKMPQKALEAVLKIAPDRVDHWLLYRKSEAQIMIRDNQGALKSASDAYALAIKDTKADSRISTYHDLLSKCHEGLGDLGAALIEAEMACSKCADTDYRKSLEERLLVLKRGVIQPA